MRRGEPGRIVRPPPPFTPDKLDCLFQVIEYRGNGYEKVT